MSHVLLSYIWIFLRIPWIFVAWRWGDWRAWRVYLPSIQYMIMGALLYYYFTCNYALWRYDISPFSSVTADLLMTFVVYPCFVLIYLSRFPKNIKRQFVYVGIWWIIVALMESGFVYGGIIRYYHGWNLLWSFVFDIMIFVMVRLHFKFPLAAYGLSVIITVILLAIFHVPVGKDCF